MLEFNVLLFSNIIKLYILYTVLDIFFEHINSKKIILLSIISLSIFNTVMIGKNDNNVYVLSISALISIIISVFIPIVLFKKEHIFKKLFVLFVYVFSSILLEVMMIFILDLVFIPIYKLDKRNFLLYAVSFIYYNIQFLVISFFKRFIHCKYKLRINLRLYLLQSVLPILSITFIVIYVSSQIVASSFYNQIDLMIIIMFSLITLISLILSIIIEYLYNKYNESECMNTKLTLKDKYYFEIEKQSIDIRKIKHDFLNHLLVISAYVRSGMVFKALDLIDSIVNETNRAKKTTFTHNTTINLIINSKYIKMNNELISFEYNIKVPNSIGIHDIDLIHILGNLLDNAMESCMKCPLNSRFIHLEIFYYNHMLVIKMRNGVKAKVNVLKTNKTNRSEHGLGMKSVETSINLYNGVYDWYSTDTEFVIDIILCPIE